MKKFLLVVSATLFMIYSGSAQEAQFGLKAGLNMASIDVKNAGDYDARAGLHVGGLAHIHISRHFAIQPELVFSMQGGESGNNKLKLNYINVPVQAQYMFNNGLRLQTGPQLGFLVTSELESNGVDIDIDDAFNTVEFAWSVGAGYLFPGTGLGVDARYNFGITDIDESSFEARNRVFQAGLFYQFRH